MARRTNKVTNRIRTEISIQGLTAYRIGKDCGIAASSIGRFLNRDGNLSGVHIDRVARYLDLVLVHKDELKGK